MVADFIKDESGLWWMIGVRAYKFENPDIKPNLKLFVDIYEEEYESDNKVSNVAKSIEKKILV
jgi:hypothetical protein